MSVETADPVKRFRNALGWFTTGVAVVAAQPHGCDPIGITINSFSSVSLDPPLVLWCLDKKSETKTHFDEVDAFTVNVLGEHHEEVSNRLAKRGGHSLEGLELATGETGAPRLGDAMAHFECTVDARHDAGDHVIMVGRVVEFDFAEEGRPLLYHRGRYHAIHFG